MHCLQKSKGIYDVLNVKFRGQALVVVKQKVYLDAIDKSCDCSGLKQCSLVAVTILTADASE